MCLDRWIGKSAAGQEKFKQHDAIQVYADSFKAESVIRASCDDYRAGGWRIRSFKRRIKKRDGKLKVMFW
jgi:hypothetical protein